MVAQARAQTADFGRGEGIHIVHKNDGVRDTGVHAVHFQRGAIHHQP